MNTSKLSLLALLAVGQLLLASAQLDKIELSKELPEEILRSNFSLDNFKDTVRSKCIAVLGEEAGPKAYDEVETGFGVLSECIGGVINYTALQQEIEESGPKGELDVVFHKYCRKRSEAVHCFDAYNEKLSNCLDQDEREGQSVIKRIVESLLNFVCHKDGDQIALFIAEDGPKCLSSQKDGIQECLNATFSGYLNGTAAAGAAASGNAINVTALPKLVGGQKQCEEMPSLQACVVERLEHCADITPANLVESMFNFIRNETVCRNYPHKARPKTAAIGGGQ
ncbi:hypothetical protein KR018_000887, partial [Drosophila ironensis]